MSFTLRVPTDDTHTVRLAIRGWKPKDGAAPSTTIPVRHEPLTYEESGRILADHIVMQDMMAWVAQGDVADRGREHLATSDKGLMLYRQLLLENVERVQRGEDPMAVIRDPEVNEPMIEIARGTRYGAFRVGVTPNYGGTKTWGNLA
jgi:5,5'-dehydrodivanillate O-demethylase